MRHTSLALKQKSNIAFFTTNKPSITCINTQGDDGDYLVKMVFNWPCYAVMLTISTANKFTSNQTNVVSRRWHGNIFRFFLFYLWLTFLQKYRKLRKCTKTLFKDYTIMTLCTIMIVEISYYCINLLNNNFISIDIFVIRDPNSKITLNRLTALRKSNLFTKYEHAVHKSCWRNKVYFSAVSCLILPQ